MRRGPRSKTTCPQVEKNAVEKLYQEVRKEIKLQVQEREEVVRS